jgi:hypothetical protein
MYSIRYQIQPLNFIGILVLQITISLLYFSVSSCSIDMDSSEQSYDLAPFLQNDPLWTENYDSDMTNLWDAQQLPICNELQ